MIRLEYDKKYFKVINEYVVNESSREVTFNNLKIDFTDKDITDLPRKYQEVHLVDVNNDYSINNIIFTGYINDISLPNMKNEKEYRQLVLELLSPMALATKRSISIIGTYYLQDLIKLILEPLILDGFNIYELNIGNNRLDVNYLQETVESSMNRLSNKYNFWWYIDQNKNIYVNDINYQFSLKPKLVYDDNNYIPGLIDIIPSINATDYCNVVNFTNVRIYSYSYDIPTLNTYKPLFDKNIIIKKDSEILFDYPIDLTVTNIIKSTESNKNSQSEQIDNKALYIKYLINNQEKELFVKVENNLLVLSDNVQIGSNSSENAKTWELVKDSFFSNLIVGIKYHDDTQINSIKEVYSCSCLMWTKIRIMNNHEIDKNKDVISKTGIIEKNIDLNEQWKTYEEVIDIASSYIKVNPSRVDQVKMIIDKDCNLFIGDIIQISKKAFLIDDKYIITDIQKSDNGLIKKRWNITCRNANYLENFIDLFRGVEKQETQEKIYNLVVSNYVEDGIREIHEVY